MPRQKSSFVSSFGIAFQVFKALCDEVLNLGGTDEDIRRIETDVSLRRSIAGLIFRAGKFIESRHPVLVNYSQTFWQMIAQGGYDHVNIDDITANNFPFQPALCRRDIVIALAHFRREMESTDAVLRELKLQGFRAATLPELLAFGATYPEKQREFPIIALGSVWEDHHGRYRVPGLYRRDAGRDLGLFFADGGWDQNCRFVAVHLSAADETKDYRPGTLGRLD